MKEPASVWNQLLFVHHHAPDAEDREGEMKFLLQVLDHWRKQKKWKGLSKNLSDFKKLDEVPHARKGKRRGLVWGLHVEKVALEKATKLREERHREQAERRHSSSSRPSAGMQIISTELAQDVLTSEIMERIGEENRARERELSCWRSSPPSGPGKVVPARPVVAVV